MPGAHDAIPIYLYLLTPATYLPNYTEWSTRSDKRFTYRTARWIYRSAVCSARRDVDIPRASRPSRAAPRLCSILLLFQEVVGTSLANSGIAVRAAFSRSSYSRSRSLARSLTGIVALCTPHCAERVAPPPSPLLLLRSLVSAVALATPGVNPGRSRCFAGLCRTRVCANERESLASLTHRVPKYIARYIDRF